MFVRRAVLGVALTVVVRSEEVCVPSANGVEHCPESDDSALLQFAGSKHRLSLNNTANPEDLIRKGILQTCTHDTYEFLCPVAHTCCGGFCAPIGAQCCQNTHGVHFQCGESSTCCGNACAGAGSKCCTNVHGYQYPVTQDTMCEDEICRKCTNQQGTDFICGINSTCCGDVCVGAGGVCCYNGNGNSFACGSGSSCCGNACAAPGSHCCDVDGNKYPVANATACPANRSVRRRGTKDQIMVQDPSHTLRFPREIVAQLTKQGDCKTCEHNNMSVTCQADQECCGSMCMPASSVCCTNEFGDNFECGQGSTCCGNACAAPGSKCCSNVQGYQYPVAEMTDCLTESTITCNTGSHGMPFYCASDSTCCGDICVGVGGACCVNEWGSNFPCGEGSSCCGNTCAAPGSKCCDIDGVRFPVAEDTICPPCLWTPTQ